MTIIETMIPAHFPYEISPISRYLKTSSPDTVHVLGVEEGYAHAHDPFTIVLQVKVTPRRSDWKMC